MHRLSGDDAWSLQLDSLALGGNDGAKTVDGFTEWVKHTSKKTVTDGNINDGTSSLDDVTFLNLSVGVSRSCVLTCHCPR